MWTQNPKNYLLMELPDFQASLECHQNKLERLLSKKADQPMSQVIRRFKGLSLFTPIQGQIILKTSPT